MPIDHTKQRHYDVLGLKPDSSQESIRLSYKKLALQWHPDRHQNDKEETQQKFIEIKEAYLALSEGGKQKKGHEKRQKTQAAPSPPSSTTAPSSTPSECGSSPPAPTPPKPRGFRVRRAQQRTRDHAAPQVPTASTSSSSSSRSGSNAAYFQQHISYLKVERDPSAEQKPLDSHLHDHSHKPSSSEDDDYELIDLVDLGSPLSPLRIPKTNLAKDWVFPLPLTLEDLYHGALHRYRITRTLNSGRTQVVKIDIKVMANWRSGTRMRVPAVGNQRKDGSFQDIVFVAKEIPHPRFTRVGDDLHLPIHVPWANAHSAPYMSVSDLTKVTHKPPHGEEVYVQTLNGEGFALPIPRSLVEGADGTRIVGAGMPIQENGKSVGKGDLFVKWVFTFPSPNKIQNTPWRSLRRVMIWKA